MYKSLYFGTFPNLSTGIIYAFNMYAKSNGAFSCSFIDTYILYCGVYYMLGFKMILDNVSNSLKCEVISGYG